MTTLVMDESGNTQQTIAVGLVSIPRKEIPKINELMRINPDDPHEIRILYDKKSHGEFKYADLRNAFRQTQLGVYDEFLRKKLTAVSQLDVEAYLTVFPNPNDNGERLNRLLSESQDLLIKWGLQNPGAAFSKDLEIFVDQQVFPEPFLFQYYRRRGRIYCELFPRRFLKESVKESTSSPLSRIPTDRENLVEIRDANSRTLKSIQLTDLLVGCAREHFARNEPAYFPIVRRLFHKEHMRIQVTDYKSAERGFISSRRLKKW